MSQILYGSQTYPWQMNIKKYRGQVPHMVDILLKAGFTGMEAEICMLEDYYEDWGKLKALLDAKGVALAALAIHEPWLFYKETDSEFAAADKAIAFLSHFPTAKLLLGHVAVDPNRERELAEKQRNHLACIRDIGRRAIERGVVTVFHPNSAPNSIFRYESDYEIMFEALSKCDVGYAPDVGHMLNGGIDPLKMIRQHREKVLHVHFKDMDANHAWATMGCGIGNFQPIAAYLEETDYRGWIMTEDESPDAERDSDGVVLADGAYIRSCRSY